MDEVIKLLKELLDVQREQLQLMKDQAEEFRKAKEKAASPDAVMANILSVLPAGLQKAMSTFGKS